MALTAHVTTSVGWLGAALSYLALVVVALRSGDSETVRAVSLVLVALASVLTAAPA